jgi:hypothetical protein
MSTLDPKEIRETYSDFRSEWQPVRDEAGLDMQAISIEGPWTDDDRAAREDAGRPCIHLDQINQYLHQYTGNLRKTKRAIQVTPKGNGANDADAKKRSSVIRGIEEKSNAPTAVYIPAAESAAQRSYGYAVIRTDYKDEESFDQEILVKPIANPDCVLLSPYYKQPNASDVEEAFLLEPITKKDFKAQHPKAKITDFDGEEMQGWGVSDWVKENYVMRAEYWKIEHDQRTLLLIKTPEGTSIAWEDELKNRDRGGRFKNVRNGIEVLRERDVMIPRVVQRLTNGLEVLDEIPWHGSRIPIISCFGPERWRTIGGRAQRQLLSLVRFARDPQMLFDFLATCECEVAGQVPKVPFVGYKGQFESDRDVWEELTKVPHAFVQADIVLDAGTNAPLPLPTKPNWEPNFQTYEIAKDSAGRSLQSSMGISPLPTAAQRSNQKSGVALEKIQDEEDIGTHQFLDNFENGFLHNMGWQINELITPIMDTQSEMPIAQPDGTRKTLHLVGKTSHPLQEDGSYEVQGVPDDHLHTAKGDFDVTIASGPSYDSERDEQSQFVDSMVDNLPNLPPPGSPAGKVLALAIRMRPNLGPIGQQIADVFDPPDPSNLPPEAQAVITQLKGQMQQLQQENTALHMDRAGRVLEQQTKLKIETMRGQHSLDAKTIDYITQIVKAELAKGSKAETLKAQTDANRELVKLGFNHDQIDRAHDAAHEVAMSGVEHARAQEMQQQAAANQQSADPAAAQPQTPEQQPAT